MANGDSKFRLPGRVDSYLATLNRLYERANEPLLRKIVVNGLVSIHEGWDYDNWDGGTHGHAVTLTLPVDIFLSAVDNKDRYESRIAEDLNKLDNSQNEHVSRVFIEMNTVDQDHWRKETGVYHPPMAAHSIPASALERIWDGHQVRVFLSHKASVKVQTAKLKSSFAKLGIGAFVAHEDIEPTEEWHREIERALFSMDAMVALLTDDYHDSNWTDQEVGVAIGRGVPLIAIRLGKDPYGLMGKGQGLGGCSWERPDDMALKVFQILFKRLPNVSRLFECAVSAYKNSTSFADSAWKVKHLLTLFQELSNAQVDLVLEAYHGNYQNTSSFEGMDALRPLLNRWTGKEWTISKNELVLKQAVSIKQEIPF